VRATFEVVKEHILKYLDLHSDEDATLLLLWIIGSYCFTLFTAYPYLILHGPKGSGKSSVISTLEPIGFNMFTTSHLTSPSLFRQIHSTRGVLGYDEAEQFNYKNSEASEHLLSLLKGGYKTGMPVRRAVGDNHRIQPFNIFSPKIFATIQGVEDVLESRCIVVPMYRSRRQVPNLPLDFDGSQIRHKLYSLVLLNFQHIRASYEKKDLHSLLNRSAELWQPILALADFFENFGKIDGLLDKMRERAHLDIKISSGAALDDQASLVLQALELMLREHEGFVDISASEIRQKVADIQNVPVEKMGDRQWVGHVLKRLHLIDEATKKQEMGRGVVYSIDKSDVIDLMERYSVKAIID
jgi:hypothetical protein